MNRKDMVQECVGGLRVWYLSYVGLFLLRYALALRQFCHARGLQPETLQQMRVEERRSEKM